MDGNNQVDSYGLCSYGLYSYGLYSHGLYSYGLHSHGLYSYGAWGWRAVLRCPHPVRVTRERVPKPLAQDAQDLQMLFISRLRILLMLM